MKRLILSLCLLSLTAIVLADTPTLPSVRIAEGPWLQQVDDEGFTVVWTTSVPAAVWVEVAPDDATHFYAAERPKYYETHLGRRTVGTVHRVRVSGLAPGTTYRYRLMQQALLCDQGNKRMILGEGYGSDILKHAPYPVTTTDPQRDELEFWMVNDIHGRDSVFRRLLGTASERKPDFVCLNGDLLNSIESAQALYDGLLRSASELLAPAGIPLVVTRGNHDGRGSYAPHWLDHFPTPTGETYYMFRQGPVCFLVLDGCEDKPDSDIRYYGLAASDSYRKQEARWLEKVVASEEFRSAPYRIVLLHMPPNTDRGWHGEREVERLFMPILSEANIDAMLCGHYHRYYWLEDRYAFPVLINSNNDRAEVRIDTQGIRIRIVGTDGETKKEHKLIKSKR